MGLQITSLRLANFRSYERFSLEGLGSLTIFVGPNAVGKSNLLEAIQLTTALSSFRSATTEQMIRWGCSDARVDVHMEDAVRNLDVALLLGANGKRYRLNGKAVQASALQDNLPAVAFCPDDLSLVKGSPSVRRAAIDALGSQLSANYRAVKRDYEKILRQKNRLLKDEADPLYLSSVNEVLSVVGAQLCRYRLQIFEDLTREFPVQYADTTATSEHAAVRYRLSWESLRSGSGKAEPPTQLALLADAETPDRGVLQHEFSLALDEMLEEERRRKQSLVGPHRDTLDFLLDDHEAGRFASQGQQRSLAIAFKLTEFRMIEKKRHQRPLLLLDDVMSEIDATRREMLTKQLQDAAQTFITTTNLEYFTPELLSSARVIHLPYQEV